jgi:hypothetical protein
MLGGLEIVVPESLKAGKPVSFKTQVFFTISDWFIEVNFFVTDTQNDTDVYMMN